MILSKLYEKKRKEKLRKLKIQTAKKIFVGTVAGSLSGLLGGLLFSPKSGKETREDIASTSKDITNNIKSKTAEIKGTIDNKVSETKNNVSDAKTKISEYLNDKKASKTICESSDTTINNEDLASILVEAEIEKK
ncbi:YtxH domain-containing protein [Clostridium sp. CS001]|uniref:YtxH domain-containing protein n=1 Tax=Clostridium sp. CS001 TaxID=2880648 RepID=UPI001CF268A9|nr:YtxH domain-containing protein [Clostridium sp. CS001]MCB2289560.1 YtxH domain-containing protein [Clostridium sp. CS001]